MSAKRWIITFGIGFVLAVNLAPHALLQWSHPMMWFIALNIFGTIMFVGFVGLLILRQMNRLDMIFHGRTSVRAND